MCYSMCGKNNSIEHAFFEFLKLTNNSSSLNKGNHDHDSVSKYDLN